MSYNVCLSNEDCIFDSRTGFKKFSDALRWSYGRGGRYKVQIDDDRNPEEWGWNFNTTTGNEDQQSIEWWGYMGEYKRVWAKTGEGAWVAKIIELTKEGQL